MVESAQCARYIAEKGEQEMYNDDSVKMAGTPTKTPDIEIAFRELEKEVEVLLESVHGLEARADKVLLPVPPIAKMNDAPIPHQPHSALYVGLDDLRQKVSTANMRLFQIKERMEI